MLLKYLPNNDANQYKHFFSHTYMHKQISQCIIHFKDNLLDNLCELESIKEVLDYRAQFLRAYGNATKNAKTAKSKFESADKSTPIAESNAKDKLNKALDDEKKATEDLERVSNEIKEEFKRVKLLRKDSVKFILQTFVKLNFDFHSKVTIVLIMN